jgi:hypothetical protein
MRNLNELNKYRILGKEVIDMWGWEGDETCGAFRVPLPLKNISTVVIASIGMGWDHVSVSLADRCPTWNEMEYIKRMFFNPLETVMQLHVPASDHINYHPYCLHLWRPLEAIIPRPPASLVGPTTKK